MSGPPASEPRFASRIVFNDSNLLLKIVEGFDAATLVKVRNINYTTKGLMLVTRRLRDKLCFPPPVGAPPMTFLQVTTNRQRTAAQQMINDTNILAMQFSPYLNGLTTQAFLFDDQMAGWPNKYGAVTVCFLPSAIAALRDHPSALQDMQFDGATGSTENVSTKIILSNSSGITLYDILSEWTEMTSAKYERGAPVTLTPLGAARGNVTSQHGDNHSLAHGRTDCVYKQIRGCLVRLGELEGDAAARVSPFASWHQDEDVLAAWYKRTSAEGETWFAAASSSREERDHFLREMESCADAWAQKKKQEYPGHSAHSWLQKCLGELRSRTAATRVFKETRLVQRLSQHLDDEDLPSLWSINSTTKSVFDTVNDIRKRLFFAKLENQLTVLNPDSMSTSARKILKSFIRINPLWAKLVTNALVSDDNLPSEDMEGLHRLYHFHFDRVHAIHPPNKSLWSACHISATDLHLTKPPLSIVHLHVAGWPHVADPAVKTKWTADWIQHKGGFKSYTHFDNIRFVEVRNTHGVTIGDVVKAFVAHTTADAGRGLLVGLSILGGAKTGSGMLWDELADLEDIFATFLAIQKNRDYHEVFNDAMTGVDMEHYDGDLEREKFVYYSKLMANGGGRLGDAGST